MSMTDAELDALATKYATDSPYAALYTTVPTTAAAGTEVTGGSPAYARKAITWSGPNVVGPLGAGTQPATHGVNYFQVTFDVPPATSVKGAGLHSAVTAGTYRHGGAVTQFDATGQSTYVLNGKYAQV